jgi:hypothetical protein
MKKLKLDDVRVDSFPTTPAARERRGTVAGHNHPTYAPYPTCDINCIETVAASCDNSFDFCTCACQSPTAGC